jgi:hypothetical protein
VTDFLELTPAEINWKVQAYNEQRREEALRDYRHVILIRSAVASLFDAKINFPSFSQFYPERQGQRQMPKEKEMTDAEARRDLLQLRP